MMEKILKRMQGGEQSRAEERPVPVKPDYEAPAYRDLCARCAMGDRVAMLKLGRWHRQWLSPEGEKAIAAYEAGEEKGYQEVWQLLRRSYGRDRDYGCYYVTWLQRAAIYGNAEAQAILDKCPAYWGYGLLPKGHFRGEGWSSELCSSYDLNRLGFLDVDPELDEFGVYPLRPEGFFVCYYLSDYIPADDSGFGREDEYSNLYYDEFFNLLGKDAKQIPEALERRRKHREKYWANPKNDAPNRRYR